MTRLLTRSFFALLAAVLAGCAGEQPAQPTWTALFPSGTITGIYGGTVAIDSEHPNGVEVGTEVRDTQSGKVLWRRPGDEPLFFNESSDIFLHAGSALELVDATTGAPRWRSSALCAAPTAIPTFASVIRNSVYAGCDGGEIFKLRLSDGRVLAAALPADVDDYDRVIPLTARAIGVSGKASSGMTYRQSAILNAATLKPIVVFKPDRYLVGTRGSAALVFNACCAGRRDQLAPGSLDVVSLRTGRTVDTTQLAPNPSAGAGSGSGAGVPFLAGTRLFVATRNALLVYDVNHPNSAPHVLYSGLAEAPALVANRYFFVREGSGVNVRKVALVDALADPAVESWSDTQPWRLQPYVPQYGPIVQILTAPEARERVVNLLRLTDMSRLNIHGWCTLSAATQTFAIANCPSYDQAHPSQMEAYAIGP
jgi:hypothetical protein